MNLSSSLPDFFNDLQKRISGDLRTDRYSRILYSTDASSYRVMPYGVLIPKTTEDIPLQNPCLAAGGGQQFGRTGRQRGAGD